MPDVHFDDIEALEREASDAFGPWSPELEVTQEMVDAFSELTGDHQWIHTDVERARRESPYGGPVAHGFLTLSLLSALVARIRGGLRIVGAAQAINYGSDKLRFLAPVPVGAKIHARTRVVAVARTEKGTRIEREAVVHVVGSERPALLYSMIALYQGPRR